MKKYLAVLVLCLIFAAPSFAGQDVQPTSTGPITLLSAVVTPGAGTEVDLGRQFPF